MPTRGKQATQDIHPAYWAGFLDGDGCISLALYRRKGSNAAMMAVIIVQQQPMIPVLLKEFFGGSMDHVITSTGHDCWRWTVAARKALAFLKHVEPYVVVKREQAALAMAFQEHLMESHRRRGALLKKGLFKPTLTEADHEFRRSSWLRMKELNTCHKRRAAATTEPSGPQNAGCDSLNSREKEPREEESKHSSRLPR